MNKGMLYSLLFETILMSCVIAFYLICLINRKKIVSFFNDVCKLNNITVYIIGVVIGIFLVGYTINCTIPDIKDIPNVINNNYYVFAGRAMNNHVNNSRSFGAEMIMCNDEGKKIIIKINTTMKIDKGDYLEVKYLPNSKHGVITEHIKK